MKFDFFENELNENVSNQYTVEVIFDGKVEKVKAFFAPVRENLHDLDWHMDTWQADGTDWYVKQIIHKMSYCRFSATFESMFTVRITPNFHFENVRLRPGKMNYRIKDGAIEIELNKPTKISVEFDGNIFENLFLFVQLPVIDKPDESDSNVIYLKKGVHDIGEILLSDNQSLYLEAGSYVYGYVKATGENIKIFGQGVLCGAKLEHNYGKPREHLCVVNHGKNVVIKDIFMVETGTWTLKLYDCKDVLIDNIAEICWNENSDGIDVCVSRNVEIRNVFLRNADDNISIKARRVATQEEINLCGYSSEDIYVHDCIFWSDKAHCMLVGPEATKGKESSFRNIRFENIICLEHREYLHTYQGVMSIFAADEARIENIIWKNIEVYNMSYGRLISIIYTDVYANAMGKGVKNIVIDNVRYYGYQTFLNRILGLNEECIVENVVIKDLFVNGKKVANLENYFRTNAFLKNIEIK